MFITRDPAGFVEGPNLYTYAVQNPWTHWDAEGLSIWTKAFKAARTGGDWGLTFADVSANLRVLSKTQSPVEAFVATWSLGSEFLPVSVSDAKAGYKATKKGIAGLKGGKRADNAGDAGKAGVRGADGGGPPKKPTEGKGGGSGGGRDPSNGQGPSGSGGQDPITMDDAVERASQHVNGQGEMITTGGGNNFQFINSTTDAGGNTVTKMGRLDVNPADGHVIRDGAHLNLETQVNGVTTSNPHIPIKPETVRKGDFRAPDTN